MKKLMFALATAAALVGMADIESANTVGYVNRTGVAAGVWQILPCQFETTQATEIDLQALVQGTFEKTVSFYDEGYKSVAPQIQIRNPQTGATSFYYYIKDAYIEETESEVVGWSDDNGNFVSTLGLAPGSGFWFYSPKACELTFAGQVVGEDTSSIKVYPIWTLLGNAFPTAFSLNNIAWTGIDGSNSFWDEGYKSTAPQIQIRNTQTGATSFYYYIKDAYIEAEDKELPGWADDNGNYVGADQTIEPGVGFWFRPTAEIDVDFSK